MNILQKLTSAARRVGGAQEPNHPGPKPLPDIKVIQIGFNKCGTRSMYRFFLKNHVPAMHWAKGTVGHDVRENLAEGRPPFEGHEEYVFYSDLMGPRGEPVFEGHFHYKEFYEAYPGSLFILNTRNEDNWIRSRQRHPNFIRRFAHHYSLDSPEAVEELWRDQWRSHHAGVRSFFADKPGQLLTFDIENHGGGELAAFVKPHLSLDPACWGHVGKAESKAKASAGETKPAGGTGSGKDGASSRSEPHSLLARKKVKLLQRGKVRRALQAHDLPKHPTIGDLLARNERSRHFIRLLGTKAADLRSHSRTLIDARPNDLADHPLNDLFADTEINRVTFAVPQQGSLDVHHYEDVYLLGDGSKFIIMRDGKLDGLSTGLVENASAIPTASAEKMGRGALCDDRYSSGNPCHFTVDRLPRVHFFQSLLGVPQSECVTVDATQPFVRFALSRVAPSVRVLEPGKIYHFDELLVLSTSVEPKGHPFFYLNRGAVDAVVPALVGDLPTDAPTRKIYLSRFASKRRRLLNERDVADMLERRGFEILEMSELSPRDQLAAVRGASVVVAPHGAALANILGASERTKVVELFSAAKGTAVYAALSLLTQSPYTPVFGTPTEGEDDVEERFRTWTVDVGKVEEALDTPAKLQMPLRR
ncbi:MAG: glycosyltransferase 61 family protein [Pseudomonadota bacterium]